MNLNDPTTVTLLFAYTVMLLFGVGAVILVLLSKKPRVRPARHT